MLYDWFIFLIIRVQYTRQQIVHVDYFFQTHSMKARDLRILQLLLEIIQFQYDWKLLWFCLDSQPLQEIFSSGSSCLSLLIIFYPAIPGDNYFQPLIFRFVQ